jgi:hypothetical protein
VIKDIFRTYVNFYTEGTGGLLPCNDGCGFLAYYESGCVHRKSCQKDIEMGAGLRWFWEKGKPMPEQEPTAYQQQYGVVHGDWGLEPRNNREVKWYKGRELKGGSHDG